jgi:hypothetical protein
MGHFKMEFPWGMTPDGTGAKLGGREPKKNDRIAYEFFI